jgi:uncharacterized protein
MVNLPIWWVGEPYGLAVGRCNTECVPFHCLILLQIERYNSHMKQEAVVQILKQKNAELTEQFGVKSLLLFGSVARNEATPTSDVDFLVEFNRPVGYFGLFALQDYLEKLLGCSIDLGTPESLKPYIKEKVMGEMIRVT